MLFKWFPFNNNIKNTNPQIHKNNLLIFLTALFTNEHSASSTKPKLRGLTGEGHNSRINT